MGYPIRRLPLLMNRLPTVLTYPISRRAGFVLRNWQGAVLISDHHGLAEGRNFEFSQFQFGCWFLFHNLPV